MRRNNPYRALDEKQRLSTSTPERRLRYVWKKTTYDNTPVTSVRLKKVKRGKKERREGETKSKKRRVREMTTINSLYFSFLSLFLSLFSSFLDLPFLSLCRRDRKGKERESGEREERKRERKGKEREFIAVIFPCSPFFYFLFSLLSFLFFLSSLSLASLTRQAWCHMSFFKHSEAVSQKW